MIHALTTERPHLKCEWYPGIENEIDDDSRHDDDDLHHIDDKSHDPQP